MLNVKTKPADAVSLSIRSENKVFIVNTSEVNVTIQAGTTLAGYGKGRFRSLSASELEGFDTNKEQLFTIADNDSLVVHQGVSMKSLGLGANLFC